MGFDDLNSFRIYIQTFDDSGNYTGVWVEITRFVLGLSDIGVQIDSSDYDVGVFQNSNLDLKLNNRDGRFNDVDATESMFNFKRKDTLVKMTYRVNEYGPECGVITVPFLCGGEVTIFKGLLNDKSLRTSARNEDANFKVLGFESVFDQVLVNFSSLGETDAVSTIIETILDQEAITKILTVSSANINVGLDQDANDTADLEGKTVKEALDELLLISNSVLYIDEDDNIIVKNRDPSATSQITFYGQASPNGQENIANISAYNSGLQRVFNYFQWTDTTINSQDADSIAANGLIKKKVESSIFTNTTKRTNFMDALLAEFKDKKIEFEIFVPLGYDTIDLKLLDRVNVDYPVPVFAEVGNELPILGIAILGEAVLPTAQWALEIDINTDFKILKKIYNFSNHTVKIKLREV